MAATPAQIRSGIASALSSAFPNVVVNAYRLEAPPDQCMHVIGTDSVEYDQAMQRGVDYWTFQVQVLAGTPVSQQAQTLLDTWKQPASGGVKAAIESDPTLGGIVAGVNVRRASGDAEYGFEGRIGTLLGCIFDVFVVNTGH